ncbi:ABC transporter permease, partial [Paenibacillus sp. 28ISP30-2]|nr:ABC transporter permease [Paenibacillus sp. 28ISP30-2]
MTRYLISKFFYMLLSLFILISATFFLMKAIPGNPFMSEKATSPEIQARLMEQYGLDKPVYVQYFKYLGDIASGDFGISMKKLNQSVTDIIGQTFSVSLKLGFVA